MIRGVPYDAEVEYLESTGTQYVDTGVYFTQNSRLDADLMFRSTGTQQFGSGRPSSSYWAMLLGFYNNKVSLFAGKIQEILAGTTTYGANIRVSIGFNIPQQSYYIGDISGTSQNITEPTTSTQSFSLFARHNGEGVYSAFCSMRLYSISIHDGANPIIDLVPVRFTNELGVSEGAMYDRVTRKLFRNKGTGAFKWGSDVARPIMGVKMMKKVYTADDYVKDGLIAMWDGIENAGWGVHDPNATVWKDLVGGFGDWEIPNSTVYENYIHLTNDKPIIETTYRLGGTWQFVYGDFKQTSSPVILIFGRVKSYTSGLFMFPYYYFYGGYEQWWVNRAGVRPFLNASPSSFHSRTCVVSSNLAFYDGDVEASNSGNNYQNRTFDLLSIGGYNGGSSNVKCMSIRYYSRALTADEIAANYAVDKVRFKLPEASS